VSAAATAQGFVTGAHTTDTQLLEAAVDGFVANNGFGLAADVSANTVDVAALQAAVAALQAIVFSGFRFFPCADGLTVADNETGLLWERKAGTPGTAVNCTSAAVCPDAHDVTNLYTWSSTLLAADGTAYTVFLADLNTAPGFAGHTDWRLPIISELQSIRVGPGVIDSSPAADDPLAGANPTG
jgi:hypothetical protein